MKVLRNAFQNISGISPPIEMEHECRLNLPVESLIHLSLKLIWGKGSLLSTLETGGGCVSPKK